MYDNFCQLKQDPFADRPDPGFLFLSPSHKAALHALISGIEARQGLLALCGAPGLGKTIILHACQARIQPRFRTLFIGYPKLSFRDVLALICQECGLDCATDNPATMFLQLYQTLQEEDNNGCPVVLLIDEAHQIPVQTLESFFQLFAFQACMEEKLFQIVLAGLPELLRKLDLPQLRALKEHLAVRVTLSPLTADESLAYICHRLTKVLMPEEELFTPGALKRIIRYARGNPRILNTLCSNMLITGSLRQQKPISVQIVREVIANMDTKSPRAHWRWGGVVAAGLLLAAGLGWSWQWLDHSKSSTLELSRLTQRMADLWRGSAVERPLEESVPPTQPELVTPPPQTLPEQPSPPIASPAPVPPPPPLAESTPPLASAPQMLEPVEPKGRRAPRTPEQEVTKGPVGQPKPKPDVPSTGTSAGHEKASGELARKLKTSDRVLLREPETTVPAGRTPADTPRREATGPASNAPPRPSRPKSVSPGAVINEAPQSSPLETSREYMEATPDTDWKGLPERTYSAALTPKRQTVHFHSFPDVATVRIDGKSVGRTPVTVQVPMGSHSVLIEKAGYTSIGYQLTIDRDGENNLHHNLHTGGRGH